jgi:hypothetical protein
MNIYTVDTLESMNLIFIELAISMSVIPMKPIPKEPPQSQIGLVSN